MSEFAPLFASILICLFGVCVFMHFTIKRMNTIEKYLDAAITDGNEFRRKTNFRLNKLERK